MTGDILLDPARGVSRDEPRHTPRSGHAHTSPAAPGPAAPPRALLLDDRGLEEIERLTRQAVFGEEVELLGAMCAEHLDAGGKRVRARLALAAAEALGVGRPDAAPWAAAVEALHNATLIHDDVQDGDRWRRGRPTTWARHGVPQAINAGDLMLMLPIGRLVARCPASEATRWRLAQALAVRAEAVVRGQAADLALRPRLARAASEGGPDAVAAYLRAIEGKTGALFALPVEGAALLAGRSSEDAQQLAEPFCALGMLFQIQDDVLDLYGEKGREAPGSDIREGKVSALVCEHVRLCPDDRGWLFAILEKPREETTDGDVHSVIARFALGDGARPSALECTLRRIEALALAAQTAPSLAREPALRALVVEVAGHVLRPIHHLLRRSGP
jgi:geranylgeranyl diphosphate synthase, type I